MKMMSQQAEAAQYTADAARHIKEVSYHCPPLHLVSNEDELFRKKA